MAQLSSCQLIASANQKHRALLLWLGALILLGSVLAGQLWLVVIKTQLMLVSVSGIVLMTIGLSRYLEPANSLSVESESLRYFHRYGQWSVSWHTVQRIFVPSFHYQLERQDIPFIGIKLNQIEQIANQVFPRLASRLLHEQRAILVLAVQQGDITMEQAQLNFSPFKMTQGYELTGPIAAWMHQMHALHQAYGAHLFIPLNCIEQSSDELIKLLEQYRRASLTQEE